MVEHIDVDGVVLIQTVLSTTFAAVIRMRAGRKVSHWTALKNLDDAGIAPHRMSWEESRHWQEHDGGRDRYADRVRSGGWDAGLS